MRGDYLFISKGSSTRTMTRIALMAAVICVLGPFSIPIGPVPVSLTVLGILLSVYLLGMWQGTASCVIYILLGLVGMPVFSGFQGGPAKLLGPTGGYIIGYLFLAITAGFFIDRWPGKPVLHAIGMAAGTALCYLFGTVWFVVLMKTTFLYALEICVLPFVLWDMLKIGIVLFTGTRIRRRLFRESEPKHSLESRSQ